jgi:hypothetical protein
MIVVEGDTMIHHFTTGFRRFAGSRKHSAKPLSGAALDKEPPAKNPSVKISLPEASYRAHDKDFAESKHGPWQRKVTITAPAPSALALPDAVSEHPAKIF